MVADVSLSVLMTGCEQTQANDETMKQLSKALSPLILGLLTLPEARNDQHGYLHPETQCFDTVSSGEVG